MNIIALLVAYPRAVSKIVARVTIARHERRLNSHMWSHSKELVEGYNLVHNPLFLQKRFIALFWFIDAHFDRGLRLNVDGGSSAWNLVLEANITTLERAFWELKYRIWSAVSPKDKNQWNFTAANRFEHWLFEQLRLEWFVVAWVSGHLKSASTCSQMSAGVLYET